MAYRRFTLHPRVVTTELQAAPVLDGTQVTLDRVRTQNKNLGRALLRARERIAELEAALRAERVDHALTRRKFAELRRTSVLVKKEPGGTEITEER
jgi:hypothetical protein